MSKCVCHANGLHLTIHLVQRCLILFYLFSVAILSILNTHFTCNIHCSMFNVHASWECSFHPFFSFSPHSNRHSFRTLSPLFRPMQLLQTNSCASPFIFSRYFAIMHLVIFYKAISYFPKLCIHFPLNKLHFDSLPRSNTLKICCYVRIIDWVCFT